MDSFPGKGGRLGVILSLVGLSFLAWPVHAQQVHRNGFESLKPSWVKSSADAEYEEKIHTISDEGAHDGQRCEYLQIQTQPGNFIYYQYKIGRGLISEELSARLWVKANRPGIQILARLILPNEPDPSNLENRLTTLMRGEVYRNVGRWQQLEIARPQQLAKQLQQLMQAQLKRPLNFSGAYIDSLVINVYGGPGATEVWIDDLEVGPVVPEAPVAILPGTNPSPGNPRPVTGNPTVEFNGNHLIVGGKKFIFRGIQHSDTPPRVLRDAGFNTLIVHANTPPATIKEGAELGFLFIPKLNLLSADPRLSTPDGVAKEMSRYNANDAVLFWHLGGPMTFEQAQAATRAVDLVKGNDPGRPQGGEVRDGLVPHSRTLNLVGVQRWPLMSTLQLTGYHDWLDQRRRLANPGTFMWAWIQTHMPDLVTQMLYDHPGQEGFNEPVGPQAEQIRLLAYTALAAGYKGLGFWSDRWLADSHQGRDRLLICALLNQELDMLEPYLVQMDDPPQWIDTSVPEVKAAVLRTPVGALVLPIWLGKDSQFVPGQAAVARLSMVVPQIPQSMQAWEVNPADVRSLRAERVVGGTRVTLPEFGLTAAVVFTSDTKAIVRFQEQARARRQLAAQWSFDAALYELEKVRKVHEQLAQQGHTLVEAGHFFQDAEARLRSAKQLWDTRVFGESYRDSQRAMRPMRILMRAHWEQATKTLDTPVASPYAVSYFSLPRHWQLMEQLGKSVATANVLPGGDFEIIPDRQQEAWKVTEEASLDAVEVLADRVSNFPVKVPPQKDAPAKTLSYPDHPKEGKQCARLRMTPKEPANAPLALERAMVALTSPTIQLQPGTWVQISCWMRITDPIKASPDGALFFDSVGGDALGVRLTEPTPWKKFTLYRRVPSSGSINVTLALTGLGTAYFDDVRIEPLAPAGAGVPTGTSSR